MHLSFGVLFTCGQPRLACDTSSSGVMLGVVARIDQARSIVRGVHEQPAAHSKRAMPTLCHECSSASITDTGAVSLALCKAPGSS